MQVIYLCGNIANQSLITAAFVFSVIKFFLYTLFLSSLIQLLYCFIVCASYHML